MNALLVRHGEWVLVNARPAVVAALVLLGAAALFSGLRSSRGLSPGRRATLLAVRAAALLAAALAVLRPARETDVVRPRRPPLAVVVDASRSMVLGNEPPGVRYGAWLRASGAAGPLREYFRVEGFGLGDPAPGVELPRLAEGGAFTGPTTPLGRTLEGLARSRPDLAGIVLYSDGRDTERPADPPAVSVPVYPVLVGSGETPDLRIEAVETPPVAFIRTPMDVRVRLGLSGLRPGAATVTLYEGAKPVQTRTVPVDRRGAAVTLSVTPTRTGRKAYRVEVTPWPGDAAPDNDRALFAVNVVRDKTRVLLVAGTPTWDVKYLRRRLTRDPGVDLISFLILRTPDDLSTVPQNELSLIPFPTEELFNQELPSFDAVIFANFDYAPYVPRHYLANVVRFVKEAAGGFAMLGGDRSFALGGFRGSPLEEILPVELSGAPPGREYLTARFRARLTPAGQSHPLFQWRPTPAENRLLWNALPELDGMNWVLRGKPGAVVLAENPETRNEHGPLPVVALGEYGAGRTLAVTADSLWRWAAPGASGTSSAEDVAFRDFWTRALRWLAHDPEMELVRLGSPPGPLRAGEPLRLRAKVYTRSYGPASGAEVRGSLSRDDGKQLPLRWREASPGEYVSDPVSPERPGVWSAEVEARHGGAPLGRDRAEFPVGPASPEGGRVGVDAAYLEALARTSGGRTFTPADDLQGFLLEKGKAAVEVLGRRVDERWPKGWLLALTIALFGLDWGLRRFWE